MCPPEWDVEHLITQQCLVVSTVRLGLLVVWRGRFQIRAENLGGKQSIYVVQAKSLLEDKGLVVVEFLFLGLKVGLSHGGVMLASMSRGEILPGPRFIALSGH